MTNINTKKIEDELKNLTRVKVENWLRRINVSINTNNNKGAKERLIKRLASNWDKILKLVKENGVNQKKYKISSKLLLALDKRLKVQEDKKKIERISKKSKSPKRSPGKSPKQEDLDFWQKRMLKDIEKEEKDLKNMEKDIDDLQKKIQKDIDVLQEDIKSVKENDDMDDQEKVNKIRKIKQKIDGKQLPIIRKTNDKKRLKQSIVELKKEFKNYKKPNKLKKPSLSKTIKVFLKI